MMKMNMNVKNWFKVFIGSSVKLVCCCRNKAFALCMFSLSCSIYVNAQNVNFVWAKSMGGAGSDIAQGMAVDDSGNVYVTGYFPVQGAYFGSGASTDTLTSAGGADVFVAKYDASGAYQWAKRMGGPGIGGDQGFGVALDGNGNVYVTGHFAAQGAYFGSGVNTDTLTSAGGTDVFVAKYNANGTYQWAKSMGGGGNDRSHKIAVDSSGNVYVTGYFAAQGASFNPDGSGGNLTSAGGNDAFLVKYDANGGYQWAKSMGGVGSDAGYGVAIEDNGNIYVTGYFTAPGANFNPGGSGGNLTSAGDYDAFIAKYNASGTYLWAKSMGGAGNDIGYGIAAVDGSGDVYMIGNFNALGANFNPGGNGGTLTSSGDDDAFIAKYDASGTYLWAKNIGGAGYDQGWDVAADGVGNVYITGYFAMQGAYFGSGANIDTLTSAGDPDVFVAKYDANGTYQWAKGRGVAVDGSGNVYATGWFSGTANFGSGANAGKLTSAGSNDAFVLKLACGDTTSSYLTIMECGEDYTLNGKTYTINGIYEQRFSNTAGCDSTVILDLTFYQLEPIITIDGFVLGVSGTYTTYQWYKDGELIPGATDSTYTVAENGGYTVKVKNEEDCEATSPVYQVTNAENSVNEISNISRYISIYPNPAQNVIYINSPFSINADVSSIDGRKILYAVNAKEISVKEFAQGIYLLRITDTDGRLIKVEKIIKE